MKPLACFVLLLRRSNYDKAILADSAHQTCIQALKVALIGAMVLVLAKGSIAATITVHPPDSDGRVFVDVVGTIDDQDFKAFKDKTDQIYPVGTGHPKKQVIVTLVSYGGRAGPALQIGDWIRKRGMSTFVPRDRTCTSACALIWLAGRQRNVGDTPQIGFHATYDPNTRRETGAGNAMVGAYLRDLGIDYKTIVFMTRADPTTVEWLTPDLAEEHGIVWAFFQPARAIPIPPQPKLPPGVHGTPPRQVIAAWTASSKSARSLAPQQKPTATAPASPNLMPMVAPVTTSRESAPQQAPRSLTEILLGRPQPTPAPDPHPQITDRIEPGSQQAAIKPGTQQPPTVAQKVVLYEEDPADANGKRFVGSAIWRTEMVTPAPGQPPEVALRADIEVPERKLAVTWSLRRNTDKSLPATHVVEINFKLTADFPSGGISSVPGILMKQGEHTRGVPLAGLAVKVTPGFYLIGLSNLDSDKERNLQILSERGWIDIPVVYKNSRRAILAIEKGTPGERAFADAFKVWEQ